MRNFFVFLGSQTLAVHCPAVLFVLHSAPAVSVLVLSLKLPFGIALKVPVLHLSSKFSPSFGSRVWFMVHSLNFDLFLSSEV